MSAAPPRKTAGAKAAATGGPTTTAAATAATAGLALASLDWSAPVTAPLLSCASPSLSGEMLRLALCEHLRTQVCVVHLVVVLFGFNSHEYEEDDDVPIKKGKLCYAAVTQSEIVLLDATQIGYLSSSAVIPTPADMLPPKKKKEGATCLNVPFYLIDALVVDSEREDQFQLILVAEKTPDLPTSLVLSTVHRKALVEGLIAMFNHHFLVGCLIGSASAHAAASSVTSAASTPAASGSSAGTAFQHPRHPYYVKADAVRETVLQELAQEKRARLRKKKLAKERGEIPEGVDEDKEEEEELRKEALLVPQSGIYSALTLSANAVAVEPIRSLRVEWEESDAKYQHPAEQFFRHAPPKYASDEDGSKLDAVPRFHRAGYIWSACAPGWSARDEERALNRPVGTYYYKDPQDVSLSVPFPRRKHLLTCFVPEKPISAHSNMTRARDIQGRLPGRAKGKATLRDLFKGRDDCTPTDLALWCEAVTRAVAMVSSSHADFPLPPDADSDDDDDDLIEPALAAAASSASSVAAANGSAIAAAASSSSSSSAAPARPPPDYFITLSSTHNRKINIVGDKSSWLASKMALLTPEREIGVICMRRKFIPPYFDTFQDIVFIMMGAAVKPGETLVPDPNFLTSLELMVDTLSPTVVPLPYHYAHRVDSELLHPTYTDQLVLQARMNALLYSAPSFSWFHTRRWIHARAPGLTKAESQAIGGVFPTTEFLGVPCYKLAKSFANAILVRVSHREERVYWSQRMDVVIDGIGDEAAFYGNESGADDGGASMSGKQSAVDDPMDIVERMLTEFVAHEQAQRAVALQYAQEEAADASGSSLSSASSSLAARGSGLGCTAEEEWRCRLSQYLYFVVNDGMFTGALNLKRIVEVLTGNMQDGPLISDETARKLESVVDFLLFLKRRTGPPLDLPSHYSPSKLASEQNFRAAVAATSLAAASVTNLAAVSSSGSPFAGMSSTSPYAASVESRSGDFVWESRRSTLQKLRDPVLMANFTCNEAVMIQLLDERYFEYLENMALNTSEHAETSMLPPLLMSLLRMDYNSGLVRAVVDKILTNQVQFDGFIPPLMALARDGTSHNTISCLRCLTMLAREFPEVIFDYGGVTLAMWHICTAKHEDLLESALDLTVELVTGSTLHAFAQPVFIRKLVDLLRLRVGQQLRYRPAVLQKTCGLLLKFSHVPSLLSLCLHNLCHKELIDIISRARLYEPILLEVCACMSQIYLRAESKLMGKPSTTATQDAVVLVRTLSAYNSIPHLRLLVHLLTILQCLIRLPLSYYNRLSNKRVHARTGVAQPTKPDPQFAARIQIMQTLCDDESLDSVLCDVLETLSVELRQCERDLELSGAIAAIDGVRKIVVSPGGGDTNPAEDWLLGRHKNALDVKKKVEWIHARIKIGAKHGWDVNSIWQSDNARKFLAQGNFK